MTLRVSPEIERGLARLASERGGSTEDAALWALRIGLTLLPIARMPIGAHALVPCECGTVLALSAGPGDAARVERAINLWSEKQ